MSDVEFRSGLFVEIFNWAFFFRPRSSSFRSGKFFFRFFYCLPELTFLAGIKSTRASNLNDDAHRLINQEEMEAAYLAGTAAAYTRADGDGGYGRMGMRKGMEAQYFVPGGGRCGSIMRAEAGMRLTLPFMRRRKRALINDHLSFNARNSLGCWLYEKHRETKGGPVVLLCFFFLHTSDS